MHTLQYADFCCFLAFKEDIDSSITASDYAVTRLAFGCLVSEDRKVGGYLNCREPATRASMLRLPNPVPSQAKATVDRGRLPLAKRAGDLIR
jgi:hypothetical protein